MAPWDLALLNSLEPFLPLCCLFLLAQAPCVLGLPLPGHQGAKLNRQVCTRHRVGGGPSLYIHQAIILLHVLLSLPLHLHSEGLGAAGTKSWKEASLDTRFEHSVSFIVQSAGTWVTGQRHSMLCPRRPCSEGLKGTVSATAISPSALPCPSSCLSSPSQHPLFPDFTYP